MASEPSDRAADSMLAAIKIVIAGGFGAGKTTLVGAVSEVQPLHTEEDLTSASIGLDDVSGVEGKTTTTVAMDFGRITISDRLVLYLFGTPGQERFWFMWDELSYGALGAVVLADTRRLDDCFASVDYFEKCELPFVIGINCFGNSPQYDPEDVRVALDLGPQIPVMLCDARQPASVKEVLITLVEHVLVTSPAAAGRPSNGQPPASQPFAASPQPVQFSDPHPQPVPPQPVPPQVAGPPLVSQPPSVPPQVAGPPLVPQPPSVPPLPVPPLPGPPLPAGEPLRPQPAQLAEPHPQPYTGPPAPQSPVGMPPALPPVGMPPPPRPVGMPPPPPPVGMPPALPPVSLPPTPYADAPPMPGAAGGPAPPLETPAAPGRAEPSGPPEPPPDAEVPADDGKARWRPPLSRWRAAP